MKLSYVHREIGIPGVSKKLVPVLIHDLCLLNVISWGGGLSPAARQLRACYLSIQGPLRIHSISFVLSRYHGLKTENNATMFIYGIICEQQIYSLWRQG
jgi:hypothetical protein